jgi:hypothetical protein
MNISRHNHSAIVIAFFAYFLIVVPVSLAQDPTPTPSTGSPSRMWTVSDIVSAWENRRPPARRIRYCNGGRFKPCVCPSDVSRDMIYRPAVEECNGHAAIALFGRYRNAFSAVVRDRENRDRWPAAGSGFGGCSFEEANAIAPPNQCSAFKAQEVIRAGSGRSSGRIHCLGASGSSPIFRDVSRVTIKVADDPSSSNDPIARLCLRAGRLPLN